VKNTKRGGGGRGDLARGSVGSIAGNVRGTNESRELKSGVGKFEGVTT